MARGGLEIQDIVTGALAGEATEPTRLSLLELFKANETQPVSRAVARGREVEEFLLSEEAVRSVDQVRRQITEAAVNYLLVDRSPWDGWEYEYREAKTLLIGMIEYLDNPNREDLARLHRELFDLNNLAELEYLQDDIDRQLDYLSETLGDDFAAQLAVITGVKPASAKRWVEGDGRPSWDNRNTISVALFVLHQLRSSKGMDAADASAWLSTPHPSLRSGLSPGKELARSGSSGRERVQAALDLLPDSITVATPE